MLGTGIGTKFALSCANVFVADLEKKLFAITTHKLFLWIKYLDDIFCIRTEGQ